MARVYPSHATTSTVADELLGARIAQPAGVIEGMGLEAGSSGLKLTLKPGTWCVGGALVVESDEREDLFDMAHGGGSGGGKQSVIFAYVYTGTGDDPMLDYILGAPADPDDVGYVTGQPYYFKVDGTYSSPVTPDALDLLDTRIKQYAIPLAWIAVPDSSTAWTDAGVRLIVEDIRPDARQIAHLASTRSMISVGAITFAVDSADLMVRWRDLRLTAFASDPRRRTHERGNLISLKIRGAAVDTGADEDEPGDYDYKAEIANFSDGAVLYVRTMFEDPTVSGAFRSNHLKQDDPTGTALPGPTIKNELLIFPIDDDMFGSPATDAQFEAMWGDPLNNTGDDSWPERPLIHAMFPIGVITTHDSEVFLSLANGICINEDEHYIDGLWPGDVASLDSTTLGTTAAPVAGVIELDTVVPNIGYLAGGALGLDEAYDGTGGAAGSGRDIAQNAGAIIISNVPEAEATPSEPFPAALRVLLDATNTGRWGGLQSALTVLDDNVLADPSHTPDGVLPTGNLGFHMLRAFVGQVDTSEYETGVGISLEFTEGGGEIYVDLVSHFAEIDAQWIATNLDGRLWVTLTHTNPALRSNKTEYLIARDTTDVFRVVDPRDGSVPLADFGFTASSGDTGTFTSTLWSTQVKLAPDGTSLITSLGVPGLLVAASALIGSVFSVISNVVTINGQMNVTTTGYISFANEARLTRTDDYAASDVESISAYSSDPGTVLALIDSELLKTSELWIRHEDTDRDTHDAELELTFASKDALKLKLVPSSNEPSFASAVTMLGAKAVVLDTGYPHPKGPLGIAATSDDRYVEAPPDRSLWLANMIKAYALFTVYENSGPFAIAFVNADDSDLPANPTHLYNVSTTPDNAIVTVGGKKYLVFRVEQPNNIIGLVFATWGHKSDSVDTTTYQINAAYWRSYSYVPGTYDVIAVQLQWYDDTTDAWVDVFDSGSAPTGMDLFVNVMVI